MALRTLDLYGLMSGCGVMCDFSVTGGAMRGRRVTKMNLDAVLGLALSALLIIYLTYALLRPEKF